MSQSTTENDQLQEVGETSLEIKPWYDDPNVFEDEDYSDPEWDDLPEHPRDATKRLKEAGDWYGPAGAKVLYVLTRFRYDALLAARDDRPFRKRVINARSAKLKAKNKDDQGTKPDDFEGVESFLPKSASYHTYRKLGNWEETSQARVAFVRRLESEDIPPTRANKLSWRLLEDLLFWSEIDGGFNVERIKFEIGAMLAFGEERVHPDPASLAGDDRSAWDAEATVLYRLYARNAVGRLPTTVMHGYKLLGLWDLANHLLQRTDRDLGEIGNRSSNIRWQELGHGLATHRDRSKLRETLRSRIQQHDARHAPK